MSSEVLKRRLSTSGEPFERSFCFTTRGCTPRTPPNWTSPRPCPRDGDLRGEGRRPRNAGTGRRRPLPLLPQASPPAPLPRPAGGGAGSWRRGECRDRTAKPPSVLAVWSSGSFLAVLGVFSRCSLTRRQTSLQHIGGPWSWWMAREAWRSPWGRKASDTTERRNWTELSP